MLKWFLISMAIILIPITVSANIVNNSGSTAADSISLPFVAYDSAGNPGVNLTTNDTLYLVVFYPNGAVAFRDTLVHNAAAIDTVMFSGDIYYNWNLAVADIDGAGKDGVFSWIIAVHDNTGAALVTTSTGQFQLYQASDYDVWATRIIDSLQAALDSLQLQDNWVAQQTEVAGLNGASPPTNWADMAITVTTGEVTVGTNNDKTGYALTAAERGSIEDSVHANAADYKATSVTVSDKTGFSLSDAAYGVIMDSLLLLAPADTNASSLFAQLILGTDTSLWAGAVDFWNIAFSTAFTGGSMGDSLNNSSYVQGSAAGIDTLSTAYKNTLLSLISDSVWLSLLAARDGVAGSFGDSAQTWGAAGSGSDTSAIKTMMSNNPTIAGGQSDMISVSGDATAADNLETMLDGTGGNILSLAQLAIRATTAEDTGLVITGADNGYGVYVAGAGSGAGFAAFGGITGQGALLQGGDTSGAGAIVRAHPTGSNSNGLTLTSTGTGKDFNATIDLDDLSGTLDAAEIGTDAIGAAELAQAAADQVWSTTTRALTDKTGFGLSTAERAAIEDSVHANAADYKADVSSLALEASLFDPATDSVNTYQANKQVQGGITADSVLEDSSSYQGSANNITYAGIDSTLGANHGTGDWSGAGTGAYTINWVLIDSTGGVDTVIAQAKMVVNNEAQNGVVRNDFTDENGLSTFNLDAGDYVVFTTYPGMVANVDSFTVSAAATDTLYVYTDSTTYTTVAFDLRHIVGSGFLASARVRLELHSVGDSLLYIDDAVFPRIKIPELTANSSGLATAKLFPNSSFTTDSTWYTATIYDTRRRRSEKFKFRVPSGTLVNIQDCVRWRD